MVRISAPSASTVGQTHFFLQAQMAYRTSRHKNPTATMPMSSRIPAITRYRAVFSPAPMEVAPSKMPKKVTRIPAMI